MDFSTPWKNSDQVLVVEGKEFHVHRCMLTLWSPVFDRMFNSGFKEKTSERIELKTKSGHEIQEMLDVMYNRTKRITDGNLHFLLELSEEYQIEDLKNLCIRYLHDADKSGIKSITYLETAHRFNLTEIVETCIKEIASVPICICEMDPGFQGLDGSLKNETLTTRLRNLELKANKQKTLLCSFRKYLYEAASEGYSKYLCEQGIDEPVFSRCPLEEQHKDKLIGQNFDIHCGTCRTRVTQIAKHFTVESKIVHHFIEQIMNSTEQSDSDMAKQLTKAMRKL